MPSSVTTVRAFGDELEKISGEMQGYTRIGRKPISIEKMLSNENLIEGLPDDFVKQSAARVSKAMLMAAGGGGLGALTVRQMNEDRRLGRMLRKQQAQQQR